LTPLVTKNLRGKLPWTNSGIAKHIKTCGFALAARNARVVPELPPNGGRGECRVLGAPAASCAKVESTRVVTTDTPVHPAFPHAMVLTVSFVLSRAIGLVCHPHLQSCLCKLERQRRGVRTTRLRRPQARALVRSAARVHRIPPPFVTIAIRPSVGWDGKGYRTDLGQAQSDISENPK
jgi:hypothetical protein